jgi:NADH/NAD ratio-sensing transcriptional regulator Rex
MATELINKDFISIKVSKKIGTSGIRRIKEFARFLEINKDAPKKVSKKKIAELADEITAASWEKFKKKHNLQ